MKEDVRQEPVSHLRVIQEYISLRERQKKLRAKFKSLDEALTAAMEKVESQGLEFFRDPEAPQKFNGGSRSGDTGRINYKLEERYQCADAAAFRAWILEDPETRIDFLQMRPVQSELGAIYDTVENGTIPGIQRLRKHRAIFTKPTKSNSKTRGDKKS
jgi:hypothetical protein